VELSRGDAGSYNVLRDEVSHKHDIRSFSFKYVSPAMGEVIVSDAESLNRVFPLLSIPLLHCLLTL
jgi:hypothetical protein